MTSGSFRRGWAAVDDVAQAHSVSDRQVRRVMEAHRSGRHVGAAEAFETVSEAREAIHRDLEALETPEGADLRERAVLSRQRAGLRDQEAQLLRHAGLISPEAYAAAEHWRTESSKPPPELAFEINRRLRKVLGERNAGAELIDAASDAVLEGLGLGDHAGEVQADNVQAETQADNVQP